MKDAEKAAPAWAYIFEAKGVQRYIFDSGRLRDAVGASQLIDEIARSEGDDLLQDAADQAGIDLEQLKFSRRAGAAFCVHYDEQGTLQRLRTAWRAKVMASRPGLEMQDGLAGGDSWKAARNAAYRDSGARRFNSAAWLPPRGHPFTAFAQRTGRPAVAVGVSDVEEEPERLDAVVDAQRKRHLASLKGAESVVRRFFGEAPVKLGELVCPRNLDATEGAASERYNPAFPFATEDTRLALVHVDLSGLGLIYKNAAERATQPSELQALAENIEKTIVAAVNAAGQLFLKDLTPTEHGTIVPAVRPLVLGGDDITALVRADFALPFAHGLLREIQQRTPALQLKAWGAAEDHLTACAGVAIFPKGQPFLMAYDVAAGLCKFAKSRAKEGCAPPYRSALAFHLVSSTLQESYHQIRDAEMRLPARADCGQPEFLTANPYWVEGERSPSFEALLSLARALDQAKAGRGKLRELRTLLFSDPAMAQVRYARWREVLKEKASARLQAVDAALEQLGVLDVCALGSFIDRGVERATPLFDALDVISAGALSHADAEEGRAS